MHAHSPSDPFGQCEACSSVPVPPSSADEEAAAEIRRAAWLVAYKAIIETGGAVCAHCGQVGQPERMEGFPPRLRWRWTGRDPVGTIVHPVAVTEARRADVPWPALCPDHAWGPTSDRSWATELDRQTVRP